MIPADTIIFAIQAALKLGQAAQRAYVDSLRDRGLSLPLPNFGTTVTVTAIFRYFTEDRPSYRPPGLKDLLDRIDQLSEPEKHRLAEFYWEERLTDPEAAKIITTAPDGSVFTQGGLDALVTIRQWQRGAPGAVSPLQLVAGTIVEIAVDYFARTPGAFNDKSPQGKAIRVLLDTFDTIPFSTTPIHDLPQILVVSTIETLAAEPRVLTGDKSTQELIKVTAGALATDVRNRIDQLKQQFPAGNALEEQRIVDWADLVFRSVLGSGGKLAVSDPKRFLGINDKGADALVDHVGTAALDFVLASPKGSIDRIFGREGLDVVVKAALAAVGEHPEILTASNNAGLKKLLGEVAASLSGLSTVVAAGTLPEVARLILEKGGENLALIWPDKNDPKRHLMIAAASMTLEIVARPAPGAKWTPGFSRAQLVELVNFVLDEFLKSPGWLVDAAGNANTSLKDVLQAVVAVLRSKADNRLTPETGLAVLRAALDAVAKRQKLLDKLGAQPAVAALIDTAIAKIFGGPGPDETTWAMVRQDVIVSVVQSGLAALGKSDVAQKRIDAFAKTLDDQIGLLKKGEGLDLAALETAIATNIANA